MDLSGMTQIRVPIQHSQGSPVRPKEFLLPGHVTYDLIADDREEDDVGMEKGTWCFFTNEFQLSDSRVWFMITKHPAKFSGIV